MLLDETCFFLAIDFDKTAWQEDALAVLETCRRIDLPAALERSRSGNGGHVWMFFEDRNSCRAGAKAWFPHPDRNDGTPTGNRTRLVRSFLSQSGHVAAGWIRKSDRSAAPEEDRGKLATVSLSMSSLLPHADQWAFLSSVERIARATVEEIVHRCGQRGRIVGVRMPPTEEDDAEPWNGAAITSTEPSPPLPVRCQSGLKLTLGDQIYIAKDELAARAAQSTAADCRVSESGVLQGAGHASADVRQATDHRLRGGPLRNISLCRADVSRMCRTLLSDLHIEVDIRDERFAGEPLDVTFQGQLRTPSSRPPPARCWPTTPACCPRRRPSGRRSLQRG